MSRINTNVQSLIAQRVLQQNNQTLGTALERLSTGLRINRGADDPAGLIASQNLRAEKTALGAAIGNAERADQVASIAEGGLQEVSGLLTELEGLVTSTANTAGLSDEEKEANQLQIDSILQTIDRLADSTSFQGSKLLNGNLGFNASSVDDDVADFSINNAKLGFGDTRDVDVQVTQSAQNAGLFLSFGSDADGVRFADNGGQFVVEVGGIKGSRELTFASGTSVAEVADAVNTFSDITGVSAKASGSGVRLDSIEFGGDEFVSVTVVDDAGGNAEGAGIFALSATDTSAVSDSGGSPTALAAFDAADDGVTDFGQDVEATINGVQAVTDGTKAAINTDFLSVELDLTSGSAAGTANAQTLGNLTAFTITGGGADFQLAGNVDIAGKVSLGIDNIASRTIGNVDDSGTIRNLSELGAGKTLNVVDGDIAMAQEVISQAIKDVSGLRGRIGAFQKNTVGATIRSLGVSLENTTAAESSIRDADFANQTAQLTRSQILVSSATNVLGIANNNPQNVLQLLG